MKPIVQSVYYISSSHCLQGRNATIFRMNPKDHDLNLHHDENLKSQYISYSECSNNTFHHHFFISL